MINVEQNRAVMLEKNKCESDMFNTRIFINWRFSV